MIFYQKNILTKTILLLGFVLLNFSLVLSQESNKNYQPLDLKFGIGIGNKSHVGNIGITSNFYLTKRISAKVSLGVGAINYGGGIVSFGPEIELFRIKSNIFSIGTTWTLSGKYLNILGDSDAPDNVSYNTSRMMYLRSYFAYSIDLNNISVTFELGYSYALTKPNYYFSGPGIPTQKQINKLERGLKSGWLATISINGLFKLGR